MEQNSCEQNVRPEHTTYLTQSKILKLTDKSFLNVDFVVSIKLLSFAMLFIRVVNNTLDVNGIESDINEIKQFFELPVKYDEKLKSK